MLSKDEFVSVIETLKESDDFMTDISAVCHKYGTSYEGGLSDMCCKMHSTIVDVLEDMFNDKDEWISWWVYDCCYGTENPVVTDDDSDGGTYEVDTPEKLYDILVENSGM